MNAHFIVDNYFQQQINILKKKLEKYTNPHPKHDFKLIASDGILYTRKSVLKHCDHFSKLFESDYLEIQNNEYNCDIFELHYIKYLVWICIAKNVLTVAELNDTYKVSKDYGSVLLITDIYNKFTFDDLLSRIKIIKYFFPNVNSLEDIIVQLLFAVIDEKAKTYEYDVDFIKSLVDTDIEIEKNKTIMNVICEGVDGDKFIDFKPLLLIESVNKNYFEYLDTKLFAHCIPICLNLIKMEIPIEGFEKIYTYIEYQYHSDFIINSGLLTLGVAKKLISDRKQLILEPRVNTSMIKYIIEKYPSIISESFIETIFNRIDISFLEEHGLLTKQFMTKLFSDRKQLILEPYLNINIIKYTTTNCPELLSQSFIDSFINQIKFLRKSKFIFSCVRDNNFKADIMFILNSIVTNKLSKTDSTNKFIDHLMVSYFTNSYPYHRGKMRDFYSSMNEFVNILVSEPRRDEVNKLTALNVLYKKIFIESI